MATTGNIIDSVWRISGQAFRVL
ncbi:uncharacterized protein ACO6RY_08741 [Pungitius sinensis]